MLKSWWNWVKANPGKVAVTWFVLTLVALPFVVVPMAALRSKIPGADKVAPK